MKWKAQNAATGKSRAGGGRGFTLLEVMIAVAIFFACAFAILAIVSQNLAAARRLQQSRVTASGLAAMISLSNRLEEGIESGDLAEVYGEQYNGFRWEREIVLRETNGLFQVNFAIFDGPRLESTLSILLYRPESIQRGNLRGANAQSFQ